MFCPDFRGDPNFASEAVWERLRSGAERAKDAFSRCSMNTDITSESYKRVYYNAHDSAGRSVVKGIEPLSAVERDAAVKRGDDVIEIYDRRFQKDANFVQAQTHLQPFFNDCSSFMSQAIATAMEWHSGHKVPYIFWSFPGARECALQWSKANRGILMNNTIGSLFDGWSGEDWRELDGEGGRFRGEIWVSLSEIYARKAGYHRSGLKLMNWIGPGADMDETVWKQMESPTLSQIHQTLYVDPLAASGTADMVDDDSLIDEWYVVPTRLVTSKDSGLTVVEWTGESTVGDSAEYVRMRTNRGEAYRMLPRHSFEILKNSWIILS